MLFGKTNFDHLKEETRVALWQGESARQAWLRRRHWFRYPRADRVLLEAELLIRARAEGRMNNLLIIGGSNCGKTSLLERLVKLHEPGGELAHEGWPHPVVLLQVFPGWTTQELTHHFLSACGLNPLFTRRIRFEELTAYQQRLGDGRPRAVLLDEFHNILENTVLRRRQLLATVRALTNAFGIPIIAAGTRAALYAVQLDPQLENRFRVEVLSRLLPREEFVRLLMAFERVLPLKQASHLREPELAARLYALCGGLVGELSDTLRRAAHHAVRTGEERITQEGLHRAGCLSPADRRRQVEAVL